MDKCKIIAIDGIDGSGKTTLCEHVAALAKSFGYEEEDVVILKALGSGEVGKALRSRLLHGDGVTKKQQVVYMATSLVDTFAYQIPELMNTKKLIIVDRYISSFFSYQINEGIFSLKTGLATDIFYELLNNLLRPDIFIYTDISVARSIFNLTKRSDASNEALNVFDDLDVEEKQRIINQFELFFNNYRSPKFKTKRDCELDVLKYSVGVLLTRWLSGKGKKIIKDDFKKAYMVAH